MTPDLWPQIGSAVAAALIVYGGIRQDLKHHAEGIKAAAETAQRAHERLDSHIEHAHGR